MSQYHVVYDASATEEFDESIREALTNIQCDFVAYESLASLDFQEGSQVLFWLGDLDLYEVIPQASNQNWRVGFLPHPEMNRLYRMFPVSKKLEEVVEDIQTTEKPMLSDLLYCNDHLVLGSVMLGNPTIMRPAANIDNNIFCKIKHLTKMTFSLSRISLSRFKLKTEKGSVVNTAALGITFVYRPDNSDFTKRIIGKTEFDHSTLDAIILAPRSISEVVRFLFSRLFPYEEGVQRLANYIGHIKSSSIEVSADHPLSFTIDSQPYTDDKLELVVKPNALKVVSQALPVKEDKETKESVCVSTLPKGEAVKALINRTLPWIHHVDYDEVKETFVSLKENAQLTESYLVLMVLSTLLATVGLFANSTPVIIGAMILAPLMAPIISLSMGVLRQNIELISTSVKTLVVGVILALFFGILLTLITPLQVITTEIAARLSPTILDLAVAVISGVAGAYASARSEVAKSLAGVAIAVALVPPLAVSGIGIGWLDWHIFSSAFLLFITNLVGMVLASTLTFLIMGFSPFQLAKKGVAYALIFVVIVSIPLSFSFAKLVDKQRVTSALESWHYKDFRMKDVQMKDIQITEQTPLYISVKLVSKTPLSEADIDLIKNDLESLLGEQITLEATTAVMR